MWRGINIPHQLGYKDLCIIQLPLVNELSFISLASRVIIEYVYTFCFVAIATRISGWQKNFVANYNVASYCPVLQVDLGQDSMFPDRRTTYYPIISYYTLYQYTILGEAVVLF